MRTTGPATPATYHKYEMDEEKRKKCVGRVEALLYDTCGLSPQEAYLVIRSCAASNMWRRVKDKREELRRRVNGSNGNRK